MDSFLGTKKKSRSLMTLGVKVEIYRTLKGKHILLTLQLEATPILPLFGIGRFYIYTIHHVSVYSEKRASRKSVTILTYVNSIKPNYVIKSFEALQFNRTSMEKT